MAVKLNEQQMQAVNSNAKKIVCIASAGAGKTATLLQRIDRLISEGADPESILALTFTNAAAQEMLDRYKRNHRDTVITPKFCTFHAFCYYILARDKEVRQKLGYSEVPNIAKEEDIRRLWTITRTMCKIKISDMTLRKDRSKVLPKERFEYDVFWKALKKQMCTENIITFDSLCYDVSDLFVQNSPLVDAYKQKYKYLHLDEFQDTDYAQYKFAESFTDSSIYCCGDPQQMLYRFRGCTNDIIKKLAESSDWELIKLPHNYRSTKQIVDYSNQVFATIWKDSPYYLAGISDVDGQEVHMHYDDFIYTCENTTTWLVDLYGQSQQGKTVAILCRTNAEVAEMKSIIAKLHIPVQGKASNSKDLIGILKSSVTEDYLVEWLASQLPNEDYASYLRLCTLQPEIKHEEKFIQTFGNKFNKQLRQMYDCRRILSKDIPIVSRFMELIDYWKLTVPRDIVFSIEDIVDGIDKLIESIEVAKTEGIYVGTIHSVKGLEYDIVHVIGANGKSFPIYKDEDQRACFYVACTRAKSELHIWFDDFDDDLLEIDMYNG